MIFTKYKKELLIFTLLISIIFILLYLIVRKYNNYKEPSNDIYTSIIKFSDEKNDIYVEYPRFKDDKNNRIVTNVIYNYVKQFKKNNKKKKLRIKYTTYSIKNFINIQFYIEDSINKNHYKNILLDLSKNKLSYISDIYEIDSLKGYLSDQFDINSNSINNFVYIFNKNRLFVYNNSKVVSIDINELSIKK